MESNIFVEKLDQFWNLILDVWNEGLFGIDIGRILVALLIFLMFLFLRQLMARFIINRLQKIAKKTRFEFDDEIVEALQSPFAFIPAILGYFFATEYLFFHGTLGIIPDQTAAAIQSITGKTETLKSISGALCGWSGRCPFYSSSLKSFFPLPWWSGCSRGSGYALC